MAKAKATTDAGADSLTTVTAEEWVAIRKDLEDSFKISQKKGETLAAYALRLAKRATDQNATSDDDWENLGDITQKWVNGAIDADEKGKSLPLPPAGDEPEAPAPAAQGARAGGKKPKPAEAKEKAPKKPAAASKKAPTSDQKSPAAAKPGGARRGRKSKHSDDAVIVLATQDNPHRAGAKDHDKYKMVKRYDGKQLGKALAAGVELAYLRYLEKRELVKIQAAA